MMLRSLNYSHRQIAVQLRIKVKEIELLWALRNLHPQLVCQLTDSNVADFLFPAVAKFLAAESWDVQIRIWNGRDRRYHLRVTDVKAAVAELSRARTRVAP